MKEDNNSFIEIARGLTNIAQLGLSVIAPIVLCSLLGVFLKNKFGIPDFVVFLLILLGIASGIYSAVSFVKQYLRRLEIEERKQKDKPEK